MGLLKYNNVSCTGTHIAEKQSFMKSCQNVHLKSRPPLPGVIPVWLFNLKVNYPFQRLDFGFGTNTAAVSSCKLYKSPNINFCSHLSSNVPLMCKF